MTTQAQITNEMAAEAQALTLEIKNRTGGTYEDARNLARSQRPDLFGIITNRASEETESESAPPPPESLTLSQRIHYYGYAAVPIRNRRREYARPEGWSQADERQLRDDRDNLIAEIRNRSEDDGKKLTYCQAHDEARRRRPDLFPAS